MEAKAEARPAPGKDEFYVDIAEYGVPGRSAWLDVDWTAHLRSVDVHGTSVSYIEYGNPEGPPVVLIHGLAGCWQNWLENIVQLGEDFRVIAVDLPGFGASDMPR